jgi:uncharacterized protein
MDIFRALLIALLSLLPLALLLTFTDRRLILHAAPPVAPKTEVAAADSGARTLTWEELVPKGHSEDELVKKYTTKVQKYRDGDPRAQEALEELRAAWKTAPVVSALNGKVVRLPGYVVPLEGDGKAVSEFLLVPYFGACIHVPPPPANQIVLVRTKATTIRQTFDVVWVTGRMRTERFSNQLADAGYTLDATKVEPYQETR